MQKKNKKPATKKFIILLNMCWNAPVSFITLGIGTLLNIISFYILNYRNSKIVSLFVLFWQYGLLMQIPEGIAWVRIDKSIVIESRFALLLNVTQPLVLYLILLYLKTPFKYGHVVLFMYFLVLLTQIDILWEQSKSIAPVEGCEHLNLGYWNTSRGVIYIVSTLLILSELKYVYWILVNGFIFVFSLVLALSLYPCSTGSLWCWMISIAGPILVLMDYLQESIVSKYNKITSKKISTTAQPKIQPIHTTKGIAIQLERSRGSHK
jgi:hypothetical protein